MRSRLLYRAAAGLCAAVALAVFSSAVLATTVNGTNGDFDVTITGTKIKIKYTPKASANCAKIVFVQSCLTKVDDVAVKPSNPNKKWKYQDDDTADDGKTCVDHVTCEADPYYNGDDAGKDGGKQGDSTSDPKKDAEMSDTPAPSVPAGHTSQEYVFETCAYCPATGIFLDCIKWSTKNDGTTTTTTLLSGANATAATAAIKEAKTAFDKNHTKGDGTTFSQEATTAAGGKKFIVDMTLQSGLHTPSLPPGSYEAGPNLLELLQGTSPTSNSLHLEIEPVGSVSGLSSEGGHLVLTVLAHDDNVFTGNPLGQAGQMHIAAVDPVSGDRVPLLTAVVLAGNWTATAAPDEAILNTPSLQPGAIIQLRFDLGPNTPGLTPVGLAVLAVLLLVLASLTLWRRGRNQEVTL